MFQSAWFRFHRSRRIQFTITAAASTAASFLFSFDEKDTIDSDNVITKDYSIGVPFGTNLLSSSLVVNTAIASRVSQCDAVYETPAQDGSTLSSSSKILPKDIDSTTATSNNNWYYKLMDYPVRFQENHAIFGPLMKPTLIESFKVYKRVVAEDLPLLRPSTPEDGKPYKIVNGVRRPLTEEDNDPANYQDNEVVVATIQIGTCLNGHGGIVHGGIISLLFDDLMGSGYEAVAQVGEYTRQSSSNNNNNNNIAVTANLNVNFKAPLPERSNVIVRVYHVKSEGRKMFFKAILTNKEETITYAEAESLYIWLKQK